MVRIKKSELLKIYGDYSLTNLFIAFLGGASVLFQGVYQIVYAIFVGLLFFCISIFLTKQKLLEFSVFCSLTYVVSLEILIHYLHKSIRIDLEYLIFIPIFLLFIKCKKDIKQVQRSVIIVFIIVVINCIIGLGNRTTSITCINQTLFPFILGFLVYSIAKNRWNIQLCKRIYVYLYVVCSCATIIQTFLGFNNDQRNGLFGVFGLGAYTYFLMIFPMYFYALWLVGRINSSKLILVFVWAIILFLCVESKSCILFMAVAIISTPVLRSRVTKKTLLITILVIIVSPFILHKIVDLYPSFGRLLSISGVYDYIFGNNNWGVYAYGRFEGLKLVYEEQDIIGKLIGNGLGSSQPLNFVFMRDAGFKVNTPYFIEKYGEYHGFHLSGLSEVILDGGIIFLIMYIIFILNMMIKVIKGIRKGESTISFIILYGMMIMVIFSSFYGNIVSYYRSMIIIGLMVAAIEKSSNYGGIYDKYKII